MPQLAPFFFVNQLTFSFLTLLALIFVFSKYILPLFTFQQVVRMYIKKLGKLLVKQKGLSLFYYTFVIRIKIF